MYKMWVTSHYCAEYREQWECKSCGYLTTLKSGAVADTIKISVEIHTKIVSDKSTSYEDLNKDFEVKS